MNRLRNQVAVVTGASRGIGAAIAESLAAEGAAVTVNWRSDQKGAERVVAKITSRGGKAAAVQADISRASETEHLFQETKRLWGRLDTLVNNAGIYRWAPLAETTEEMFHAHFKTNVLGVLLATREAAKLFGPEGGSVINIGSVATSLTMPGSSVYAGSKGAVDTITRVLSKELGPRKIRVNSINPGLVETEGVRSAAPPNEGIRLETTNWAQVFVDRTPLGRIGRPEEIAQVAVYLASAESAWLTGEILLASGGLR